MAVLESLGGHSSPRSDLLRSFTSPRQLPGLTELLGKVEAFAEQPNSPCMKKPDRLVKLLAQDSLVLFQGGESNAGKRSPLARCILRDLSAIPSASVSALASRRSRPAFSQDAAPIPLPRSAFPQPRRKPGPLGPVC